MADEPTAGPPGFSDEAWAVLLEIAARVERLPDGNEKQDEETDEDDAAYLTSADHVFESSHLAVCEPCRWDIALLQRE